MDSLKLRLKLGNNKLEAEGPQEYIEKQRDWFMANIKPSSGSRPAENEIEEEAEKEESTELGSGNGQPPATNQKPVFPLNEIQKIASLEGDLITLTALPNGETEEQDAMMILLLAHRVMRNMESVPTIPILNGMKQSGLQVERLDRISGKVPTFVISTGVKKGTKYRLTGPGVAKAKELATALIATLVA